MDVLAAAGVLDNFIGLQGFARSVPLVRAGPATKREAL